MKRHIVCLTCALLLSCAPQASTAWGQARSGPGAKVGKQSNTKVTKRPKIGKAGRPDSTLLTDLSVNAGQARCFWYHSGARNVAEVVVKRDGGEFDNLFIVRLEIYESGALVEQQERLVGAFGGPSRTVTFNPGTSLRRANNSSPQIQCRYVVDKTNNVRERREDNNFVAVNAPSDEYNGPHE